MTDTWTAPPGAPATLIGPGEGRLGWVAQRVTRDTVWSRSTMMLVLQSSTIVLACLLGAVLAQVVIFSGLEERAHQHIEYAKMRNALAAGTAPTSGVASSGSVLRAGTPVAVIEIPRLHLRDVVAAGTSAEVLNSGPGWLRSSVFPGQAGVSAIYGRAEAYGGPFSGLSRLGPGDTIVVTTQVDQTSYRVTDTRVAGSPEPAPLSDGQGRLTLVTAKESLFVPSGLLYVDAIAAKVPSGSGPAAASVARSERPLGIDTSRLSAILVGLEMLLVVVLAAVWAWHRWGRSQTWIVAAPVLALLAYFLTSRLTDLMPNLT